MKAFFREVSVVEGVEAPVPKRPEDLERQIEQVIHDLDVMAKILTTKEHPEILAYFKTKTSLLGKLIGMKEKVLNLREISEFQAILLGFMNDICSRDQISTLMQRLRHLNSVEAR